MRKFADTLHTFIIRAIVLLMALLMLLIGVRMFTRHVLINRYGMSNAFTSLVMWDDPVLMRSDLLPDAVMQGRPVRTTLRLYGGEGALQNRIIRRLYSLSDALHERVERYTQVIDTYANHHLMFRQPIVEAANAWDNAIGWNLAGYSEYNNVIDLGDGYLTTFNGWLDFQANVAAVAEFKESLDARGIPLLFVQYPGKLSPKDTSVDNVVDFYNDNANRLVQGLRAQGVPVLDLRESIVSGKLDHHALFYNTDHHWRAETGLWAAGETARALNALHGFSLDTATFNSDNFTYDTYKNWFLGSLGKKVTLARAKPDEFKLIYPKNEVSLTLEMSSDRVLEGDFGIIYDMSQVTERDYYHLDPYGAYLHASYADSPLKRLRNHTLPQAEQPRILMLGDSFNNVVVPFMALAVKDLDAVDLRAYAGSLQALIDENQYDAVVISYSTLLQVEQITGTSMYDFR